MKKVSLFVLLSLIFPSVVFGVSGSAQTSLSILPQEILQGEPIMIRIEGEKSLSAVKNIYFESAKLGVFMYQNKPTAFFGVDLNKKPRIYKITAVLSDGTTLEKNIEVLARKKIEAPLGIPAKLGGNTAASQKNLVDTLALENQNLLNLRTGTKSFWTEKFKYPVANPVVTDSYGYSRITGSYSIAHKGADFRAKEGTQVLAVNRGVVRLVKNYRNYGKTVVVDHGLGLMSFYMHLSKIKVNVGELVLPGQVVGLSGQSGYAEQPHLHFTFRIKNISVDPIEFLDFFK